MIIGTLTGDAAVVTRFSTLADKIRAKVVDSLQRSWFRVQAAVVTDKLSGDPLHRRTGVLASSINARGENTATTFIEQPAEITGRIGTKVWYGKVHEDGGTFKIPAHARRLTEVFGHPIQPRTVIVGAHSATFPQRSFLRSTLHDLRDSVVEDIRRAVGEAAKEN